MKKVVVIDDQSIFKLPSFYTDDKGVEIKFYIKSDSGNVFDLAGYGGTIMIRKVGDLTNKVETALIISDPSSGLAIYTASDGDFDEEGLYDMYIEFDNSSRIFTLPIGRFRINPSI